MKNKSFDFVILRASPDPVRFESLNAGVVVFDAKNTVVIIDDSGKRLPLLHPDLGRVDFSSWGEDLQSQLRSSPPDLQHTLLSLISTPFIADKQVGKTIGEDAKQQASLLFERMVERQKPCLQISKNRTTRQTKLFRELKDWFKHYKIYSQKIEGLSNHLIVPSYPIDIGSDLYADFALKNGKLSVIETLDLRNLERLTPTVRGEAALKGITLNSAENAHKIAVIQASDYSVAKPAINVIGKYADNLYDLSNSKDKQSFSKYIAKALNKPDLFSAN